MLTDALADTATWGKVWSNLFGNEVTAASPKVKYMRSVWSHAGPIKDGSKRYRNIKDDKSKQSEVLTDFQKNMRDWSESGDTQFADVEVKIFGNNILNVYIMD